MLTIVKTGWEFSLRFLQLFCTSKIIFKLHISLKEDKKKCVLTHIDWLIWNCATTGQKPKAQPSAFHHLIEVHYNDNSMSSYLLPLNVCLEPSQALSIITHYKITRLVPFLSPFYG